MNKMKKENSEIKYTFNIFLINRLTDLVTLSTRLIQTSKLGLLQTILGLGNTTFSESYRTFNNVS
jgi:hypothetical protein